MKTISELIQETRRNSQLRSYMVESHADTIMSIYNVDTCNYYEDIANIKHRLKEQEDLKDIEYYIKELNVVCKQYGCIEDNQ